MLFMLGGTSVRAEPQLAQFAVDGGGGSGWTVYKSSEGATLERRKVPGSAFYEHRAVVDVPIDPERAADEIWTALRDGDMDSLKHREILRAAEDELVIYDQIGTPVVSDRDYTIVVRRVRDGRRVQFRCVTANELGPPPAPRHVRIPIIRAGWQTEPDGHGGTRLSYFAYSEPGGLIGAWLARGAQADRSLADVVRMVRRLRLHTR
jgi:hypothetical protein